jgi:hypothetical protein
MQIIVPYAKSLFIPQQGTGLPFADPDPVSFRGRIEIQ